MNILSSSEQYDPREKFATLSVLYMHLKKWKPSYIQANTVFLQFRWIDPLRHLVTHVPFVLLVKEFQKMCLMKRGLKEHSTDVKQKSFRCNKLSASFTSFFLSSPPSCIFAVSLLHLPSCLLSLWVVFSCCPFLSRSQQLWRTSMSYWASCTLQTNTHRHDGTKKIKIARKKMSTREKLLIPEEE